MIHQVRALTPADSKFRLPSTSGYMQVTADMASDWLTSRNLPTNRPISRHVTARYLEDMAHDRWLKSPVPVIFDESGYLIDGQHRLTALANSGKTFELWISVQAERDIFGVLDSGYKRAAAHMLGPVKNRAIVAAGARYLAALSDNDKWGIPRYGRITVPEVLAMVTAFPELTWYSSDIQTAWRFSRVPPGPHAAVMAQAARTEHIGKIKPWLDTLGVGVGLEAGDAGLVLRNRYVTGSFGLAQKIGQLPKREVDYIQIVKAWNAYVAGEKITRLRVAPTESLPQVTGFDWADPPKSA